MWIRCTQLISYIHLHSLYQDLWLQARCLSRFVTDNCDFTWLLKICCKLTEMLWERNSKRIRSCSVSLMSSLRAEWVQLDSRADDFRATAYTPAAWPTQPPIERERWFFPRVKRPALETCHELPSKAEVKNMSTLPLVLIAGAWLSEWTNFMVFGCGRSGNMTDKITVPVRWKFVICIPWLIIERDWWDMDGMRHFLIVVGRPYTIWETWV
jgi:hypothetical protein